MTIEAYFRKKPAEIAAVHFVGDFESAKSIAAWCGGTFEYDKSEMNKHKTYYWSILIPTLEGTMRASYGDYIIRGIKGEFYPCKPDIFNETYEEMN